MKATSLDELTLYGQLGAQYVKRVGPRNHKQEFDSVSLTATLTNPHVEFVPSPMSLSLEVLALHLGQLC